MPECWLKIRDQQSEKKRRNRARKAICNATHGIGAGRGVIRHRGVSGGSDRAHPVWRSHSARTELFLADVKEDFCSSSPDVQANIIDNIHSMIGRRIHSTCTEPAMAQHHNNQGSFDEVFLDYIPEELIEQPTNSSNHLSSVVAAATEASL